MTVYLFKSILCSGICLMAWRLIFSREKMHGFNRFYLLGSLAFSLLAPMIPLSGSVPVTPLVDTYLESILNEPSGISISSTNEFIPEVQAASPFNWTGIFLLLYAIPFLFLLLRLGKNLLAIFRLVKRHPKLEYRGTKLVILGENIVPHSFLNYIFIGRNDFTDGKPEEEVFLHERAHIRQRHSYDIIFAEILQAVWWFNPFLTGYRKAIALTHEYLADDAVLNNGCDVRHYQFLLIHKAGQNNSLHLTSRFNFLMTKKRLIMMTKVCTPLRAFGQQLLLLPLVIGLVFLFAESVVAQVNPVPAPPPPPRVQPEPVRHVGWVNIDQPFPPGPGLSQKEMEEYAVIANTQILMMEAELVEKMRRFTPLPASEEARLAELFKSMTLEQRKDQKITFIINPPPPPERRPGAIEFKKFSNPAIYGVWINGVKVSNAQLQNYKAEDFGFYNVSRLLGSARTGKTYTHQVDLMTRDHYSEYCRRKMADPGYKIVYRRTARDWILIG